MRRAGTELSTISNATSWRHDKRANGPALSGDLAQRLRQAPHGRRDGRGGIAAEPQHEALPRLGADVHGRERAHDDAFMTRSVLDGGVGQAITKMGDEMHALIGRCDFDMVSAIATQRLDEPVTLI